MLETLEQRLATVPLGPPNMNTLIGAARDIADGHILLDPKIVDRILRAALSNPATHRHQQKSVNLGIRQNTAAHSTQNGSTKMMPESNF
ncbi:MAG: hypothetical protein IPN64_12100 [Propionivibrio sp.]|uniref:hypothetical protein n=1 Tax=Propionivibrio sp. TaxID=2212460 RepID=UPI0025D8692A|nr:hypothetical protein [Propionivibrio sp.]MBK8894754.1 hypothetical protein [Propionivibrio sp.]